MCQEFRATSNQQAIKKWRPSIQQYIRHLIASHVREPEPEDLAKTCPDSALQKLWDNKCCCLKPLSLGIICCTAIHNYYDKFSSEGGLGSFGWASYFLHFISCLHELQGLERTLPHTFFLCSTVFLLETESGWIYSEELSILDSGQEELEASP